MTAAADHQRILLCRPAAGLNDTFCQIGRACRHGADFRRTVIVETDFASARHFKHAFSNYFDSADPNLILDAAPHRDRFDRLDVAPDHLFGRVNSYVAEWVLSERAYLDVETRAPLTIDLSMDYAATLLVHHASGRRGPALEALARLRLRGELVQTLGARLRAIGRPYGAVHIRNTDLKADYAPYVERIARAVDGPVFVATDDPGALDDLRSAFGRERVYSFANLAAGGGGPLHKSGAAETVYERNSDAILDLLMLALARQLWILPLKPNVHGSAHSGFSVLAKQLKEAPGIVRRLLGGDGASVNAPA